MKTTIKTLALFCMVSCITAGLFAQSGATRNPDDGYMRGSAQDLTGIYEIELRNGFVMDLAGISTDNGIAVVQNARNGQTTQQWRFERLSTGKYIITNVHSGKALDVQGGRNDNGARIHQWNVHRNASQQWHIFNGADGWFGIQNEGSKRMLDMSSSNFNRPGHQFHQWAGNDGQNQQFRLKRVGNIEAPRGSAARDHSGVFEIHLTNGNVMDTRGISRNNGIAIIQNTHNGGETQKWRLERFSPTENIYFIVNVGTGRAVHIEGGKSTNGAKLHQWEHNRNRNSQWRVIDTDDGFVVFENVVTGKRIDMSSSNFNRVGHQFHQWDRNNRDNQKFRLVSTR